jgi:peptidoglycan L-alanyl-D-glutamate endopeptidase CwlK
MATIPTPAVDRDLSKLAPKFRRAVEAALAQLQAEGIDAMVNEGLRSDALQRVYFARGVTKARTVSGSWHGYGLAVDIISKKRGWDVWPWRAKDGSLRGGDPNWWRRVVEVMKLHGLDWGGDWESIFDAPHFQWEKCKASPSATSKKLFAAGRPFDVWPLVGAE